jgi:hypothetical protein
LRSSLLLYFTGYRYGGSTLFLRWILRARSLPGGADQHLASGPIRRDEDNAIQDWSWELASLYRLSFSISDWAGLPFDER